MNSIAAFLVALFVKRQGELTAMVLSALYFKRLSRHQRRRYWMLARRQAQRIWAEGRRCRQQSRFLADPLAELRKAEQQIQWRFLAATQPGDQHDFLMKRAEREAGRILAEAKRQYWYAADMYAMTTKMHTDITVGAPANASVWNSVYGQLDSALADTEAALGDFIVSGGLAGTSASLTISVPALRAFVLNTYVQAATQNLTVTLNQDTYVDVDSSGVLHMSGVANGAAVPALFANSIRLFKAVSGASTVTSVVDMRALNPLLTLPFNLKTNGGANGLGLSDEGAILNNAPAGPVYAPPGTYLINTSATPKANSVYFAYPGTVTLKRTVSGDIFVKTAGISNVSFIGLNFDMTATANSALTLIGADATAQVVNLLIRDCQFKNPLNSWLIQINYTIVDPAIPTLKNRQIRIEDCVVDATGMGSTLGPCIVINSQDVLITGTRFINSGASNEAQLAIYGYCRDVRVANNHFEGWTCTRASYCQQGDGIVYTNNEFRTTANQETVKILNCKDVQIEDNPVMVTGNSGIGVVLIDATGVFDLHTALYTASSQIKVRGNRMDVMAQCFKFDVSQAQGQTDITFSDNQCTPLRQIFGMQGMPAAPSATVKRLTISNNTVASHSAISPNYCIDIVGNASAALGGVQTVVIQNNVIAASGSSGGDISVTNLADDVFIDGNRSLSAAWISVSAACTNVRMRNNPPPNTGVPTTGTLGVNVATVTVAGDEQRGRLTITAAAGAIAQNTAVCTVTFAKAFPFAPRIVLTNASSGATDATHFPGVFGHTAGGTTTFVLVNLLAAIQGSGVALCDYEILG